MSDNRVLKLLAGEFQSDQVLAEHRKIIAAIDAAEDQRKEVTYVTDVLDKPIAAIVPVEVAQRGQHPLMQIDAATGKVSVVAWVNPARLATAFAAMLRDGTLGLRWMNEAGLGQKPEGVSLEAHIERWLAS